MNMLARLRVLSNRITTRTILRILIALGAFGFAPINGTAQAETCLESVNLLAERYGLAVDPPDASLRGRSPAIDSQDLARSGGVIEPPQSENHSVIEPPEGLDDEMRTIPSTKSSAPAGSNSLSASDRALAETILMSARNEAEQGDHISCLKRLQEAKQILQP